MRFSGWLMMQRHGEAAMRKLTILRRVGDYDGGCAQPFGHGAG